MSFKMDIAAKFFHCQNRLVSHMCIYSTDLLHQNQYETRNSRDINERRIIKDSVEKPNEALEHDMLKKKDESRLLPL